MTLFNFPLYIWVAKNMVRVEPLLYIWDNGPDPTQSGLGGNYGHVYYILALMYTIILNFRINNHFMRLRKETVTEICSYAVKNLSANEFVIR